MDPIGDQIYARLTELGRSAAWLADEIGVSRSTITRVIHGDRNPGAALVGQIASVLRKGGGAASFWMDRAPSTVSREKYDVLFDQLTNLQMELRQERTRANRLESLVAEIRSLVMK
jgi:transcriptional regulator with XRE-family HTH domain